SVRSEIQQEGLGALGVGEHHAAPLWQTALLAVTGQADLARHVELEIVKGEPLVAEARQLADAKALRDEARPAHAHDLGRNQRVVDRELLAERVVLFLRVRVLAAVAGLRTGAGLGVRHVELRAERAQVSLAAAELVQRMPLRERR